MTNLQKYENAFTETLGLESTELAGLNYQGTPRWDSVGHMALVAAIEEDFDIMFDTSDIIDFSSFEKGKELLVKYDVEF